MGYMQPSLTRPHQVSRGAFEWPQCSDIIYNGDPRDPVANFPRLKNSGAELETWGPAHLLPIAQSPSFHQGSLCLGLSSPSFLYGFPNPSSSQLLGPTAWALKGMAHHTALLCCFYLCVYVHQWSIFFLICVLCNAGCSMLLCTHKALHIHSDSTVDRHGIRRINWHPGFLSILVEGLLDVRFIHRKLVIQCYLGASKSRYVSWSPVF